MTCPYLHMTCSYLIRLNDLLAYSSFASWYLVELYVRYVSSMYCSILSRSSDEYVGPKRRLGEGGESEHCLFSTLIEFNSWRSTNTHNENLVLNPIETSKHNNQKHQKLKSKVKSGDQTSQVGQARGKNGPREEIRPESEKGYLIWFLNFRKYNKSKGFFFRKKANTVKKF